MALVTTVVAFVVVKLLLAVLPKTRQASVVGGRFVAALVSVPVSALVFTLIYAIGGTAQRADRHGARPRWSGSTC